MMSLPDSLIAATRGRVHLLSGLPLARPEAEPEPLVPGFLILRPLGEGGHGRVYLAESIDGRQVALKVPTAGSADVAVLHELNALNPYPPNVVRVLAVTASEDGRPCVVMEFCPGGSLADRLDAEGKLTPDAADTLLDELATGLDALHAAGFVHRDLSDQNVLFDADGRAKVADFGLTKTLADAARTTGTLVGTRGFVPLERLCGKGDHRIDLYSLGAVAYTALTGQPPVGPTDVDAVPPAPTPLRQLCKGVSRGFAAVVHRLLAPYPGGRFASAADVRAELARLRNGGWGLHNRVAVAVNEFARRVRRNWGASAVVGLSMLLAAVVVCGLVWWTLDRESDLKHEADARAVSEQAFAREMEMRAAVQRKAKVTRELTGHLITSAEGLSRYQGKVKEGAIVLERARAALAEQAAEAERDPTQAGSAADLYRRCGRLAYNLDDRPGATADYDRALKLAERADEADPSPEAQLRLAGILREWGVVKYTPFLPQESRKAWDRALALLQPLADRGPDYRFTLAQVHMVRGNGGERKDQLVQYAAAEELLNDLLAAAPNDRRYRFTLAETLTNRVAFDLLRPEDAIRDCRKAVALRRGLVRDYPDYPEEKAYLAAALNTLGVVLRKGDRSKQVEAERAATAAATGWAAPTGRQEVEPRAVFEEAQTIYRALVLAFPGVKSNSVELKDVEENLRKLPKK